MTDIRTLIAADAALYRPLRMQALQLNPEAFLTTAQEYAAKSLAQISPELSPAHNKFTLGAFSSDDRLIGVTTFIRSERAKLSHIGNVQGMYVDAACRRLGIGHALLRSLIQQVSQLPGLEQLRLTVIETNDAARRLYESIGFVVFAMDPNAVKVGDSYWNELQMLLPLHHGIDADTDVTRNLPDGFSHVTINVQNLEQSLAFYLDTLQMRLVHRGKRDAYIEWGNAWVCLQERPELRQPSRQLGVDHVAFYTNDLQFQSIVERLHQANVSIVREPQVRGGGWTVNFLDPDGTQLEIHTGTLARRMKEWK